MINTGCDGASEFKVLPDPEGNETKCNVGLISLAEILLLSVGE